MRIKKKVRAKSKSMQINQDLKEDFSKSELVLARKLDQYFRNFTIVKLNLEKNISKMVQRNNVS